MYAWSGVLVLAVSALSPVIAGPLPGVPAPVVPQINARHWYPNATMTTKPPGPTASGWHHPWV